MNGSLPRTRMSRNSTDSPLIKPTVNDLGYTKDAIYGELTCAAPGCGYPGPTGFQGGDMISLDIKIGRIWDYG